MDPLTIGVAAVALNLRHARNLKDKRQILNGLKQKLRNAGFSVSEFDVSEHPQRAGVGYSYIAANPAQVETALKEAESLFIGDWEVVRGETDLLEFDFEKSEDVQNYWDSLL